MNPETWDGVRIGGLMRCCTDTLWGHYPAGPARIAVEGQKLQCKHAPGNPDHVMRFRDGAWEWDHD